MSLNRVLKVPAVRALLNDEVRAPGGWIPPKLKEPARGNAPKPLARALGVALRFGMAVRGWGVIRDMLALRGLYRLRVDPDMGAHVGLARAQADEAFAALARFEDGARLSEPCARACYLLAGLEVAAVDSSPRARVHALTRGVTRAELAELQALYLRVPWASLVPTERTLLRPSLGEGPLGALRADLVIDDRLVGVTLSESGALRPEQLYGLVIRALLANRRGLPGDRVERVERVELLFVRCAALRSFTLDACVHPADQDDLLDELLARVAESAAEQAA